MRTSAARRAGTATLAWLAALALLASAPAGAVDLTPREQAGKRIYLTGESASGGQIAAKLGRDGSTLPGSVAPCGSCHGADGRGRPEGGVRPPAVTWPELTKSYGHAHDGGRKHPAFTDESLARAVRDGLDPAGNVLDVSMPRFAISDEDLASLSAYLRRLEDDLDPGIGPDTLRLGAVLPTSGGLAEVGLPMRAVLSAWFDALNARGGIHGRKVELVVAGYDGDRGDPVAAARDLVRQGSVLALVSGFFPAAEPQVGALLAAEGVPLVGPFSLLGPEDGAAGPAFQPLAGLPEQARALAAVAVRDLGAPSRPLAVLHEPGSPFAEAARAAVDEVRRRGGPAARTVLLQSPEEAVERLRAGAFSAVLVLARDASFEPVVRALAAAGSTLPVLASGTVSGRSASQLASLYRGPVLLAFPTSPSDETPAAAQELARLREAAGASGRARASVVSAVVDASVLVEALRRSGRALGREKLVASLEALHAFETGLSPPVTFGPDRRVGARGAHVVRVEPEGKGFRAVGWIALDQPPR